MRWFARRSQPVNWALKSATDSKLAAGQEARLEVAVGPLDQPLRFRVAALAQLGADAERAAERLELGAEHLLAAAPLADRPFLVPHHPPRQRPELGEHLEMAGRARRGPGGSGSSTRR